MAFTLEVITSFSQPYIKNYLISTIRSFNIKAVVHQQKSKIICAFDSYDENLQLCLEAIASTLPASCFMSGSQHDDMDGEPESVPDFEVEYPLGLGLCPSCQKEMFDPSSKRYYYPFTQCTHCGGQYAFSEHYPYERSNTALSYVQPCPTCEHESQNVGRREKQVLNSCHECGIPVKLLHKDKERYANDAGSFRTMFEVAAKALRDGKTLLMKTTMGYRRFYRAEKLEYGSVLMLVNATKITDYCSLINDEFNALLSIERPILHVALKDETIRSTFGTSIDVKYPDEGFSILLGKELTQLGLDYIVYEALESPCEADFVMEFDLNVQYQSDMRLFINKDIKFITSGERISFPSRFPVGTDTLSIAHGLVGIKDGKGMLFDQMERFTSASTVKVNQLESEVPAVESNHFHTMAEDEASFMSVIAEHGKFGTKVVGAHFQEEASFLYYDGKKVIRVVPPHTFSAVGLIDKMSTLREGSDRLMDNIKNKLPHMYDLLLKLEQSDVTLFEATAMILGLEDKSYEGVMREALKFIGKGGLQIDTKVHDNRFNHVAFLSSIISYQIAGVDSVYLSYSIFESFGDYFSELLNEIKGKTKATDIVLCGSYFGGQSLFSRLQRNLKATPPLLNVNYPIGKENCVVGGVFI
jgi:hydrogenase maturation protein HypF